jgi:hypothetical protein
LDDLPRIPFLIPFSVSDRHDSSVSCLSLTEMREFGLFWGSDGHKAAPSCLSLPPQRRKGAEEAP